MTRIKKFYETPEVVQDMARQPGHSRGDLSTHTTVSLDRPRKVLSLLKPVMKGKVLDVGIGGGPLVRMLGREKGVRVYGLDISKPLLRKAKRRGAKAVAGAGELMPFREGSFDSAMCLGVVGHVQDPSRLFAEVHRVLKPGGRAVVNIVKKGTALGTMLGPEEYRHFTREEAEKMLKDSGFVVEKVKAVAPEPGAWKSALFFYATKKR